MVKVRELVTECGIILLSQIIIFFFLKKGFHLKTHLTAEMPYLLEENIKLASPRDLAPCT